MALKCENLITWSWKEVFWIYWISFSLLIPISIGFLLLFLGKFYQYFNDNITPLEGFYLVIFYNSYYKKFIVKGVFSLFFYTSGLTINSLISSQNFIQCLEYGCPEPFLYSSFIYFIVFLGIFLIITLLLRKDLMFIFI